MYNIIPFVVIISSLLLILVVILRRFPQLARIDTDSDATQHAAQTKHKILAQRLSRKTEKFTGWLKGVSSRMSEAMKEKVSEVHEALEEKKSEIAQQELQELLVTQEDEEKREEIVEQHLEEAAELVEEEDFAKAEQKYIDIISADPKNIEAYLGLGEVYVNAKMYNEAKETLLYVTRLEPDNAVSYFELAKIAMEQAEFDKAVEHAQKAVELEQSPRYISFLIDSAITAENKVVASNALSILKEVNADNGSISKFEEDIAELV